MKSIEDKTPKIRIKIPDSLIDFIWKVGSIFKPADENSTYFNLPQWFRKNADGTIEESSFDGLPESLKKSITKNQAESNKKNAQQEAIAFGEWIAFNGYDWVCRKWVSDGDEPPATSEELYRKFQAESKNPNT